MKAMAIVQNRSSASSISMIFKYVVEGMILNNFFIYIYDMYFVLIFCLQFIQVYIGFLFYAAAASHHKKRPTTSANVYVLSRTRYQHRQNSLRRGTDGFSIPFSFSSSSSSSFEYLVNYSPAAVTCIGKSYSKC